MKEPIVSVVIPCYNGAAFIGDAIKSVLVQTEPRLELIVVDDGSIDASADIVASVSDERVRLIRHESNRGIAAARNTAIRSARGEFIALLDQDDVWKPEKLARQLAAFADAGDDVALVYSNIDVQNLDSGAVRSRTRAVPADVNSFDRTRELEALFLNNYIASITILARRRCLEDVGVFDETIKSGSDDFELFLRLRMKYRFHYIDASLAVRREHDANFTNPETMLPDALRLLDEVVAAHPELAPIRPRARSEFYFRLARDLHYKRKRTQAMAAYRESLSSRPANGKALAGMILLCMGSVGGAITALYHKLRR